jgi:tetratricopeptide (TPR) repeat protein
MSRPVAASLSMLLCVVLTPLPAWPDRPAKARTYHALLRAGLAEDVRKELADACEPMVKQDYVRGAEALRQFISRHPDVAGGHGSLAGLLLYRGELDAAEKPLRELERLAPKSAVGPYLRGLAAIKRGDAVEARRQLELATKREPAFVDALNELGLFLSEREEHEEAVAVLARSVESDPAYAPSLYHLGRAQHYAGRRAASIESLKKAVAVDPRHADAWTLLSGNYVLEGGNAKEALAAAQKAVELAPQQAPGHFNAAESYKQLNRWAEAAAAYKRYLELAGDRWPAHLKEKARREIVRMEALAGVKPAPTVAPADLAVTGEEEKGWQSLVDAYVQKGLARAEAEKVVRTMRESMTTLSSRERMEFLETSLQRMGAR